MSIMSKLFCRDDIGIDLGSNVRVWIRGVWLAATLLVAPISRAALFADKAIDEYANQKLEPVIKKCDENKRSIDALSETVNLQTYTINKLIDQMRCPRCGWDTIPATRSARNRGSCMDAWIGSAL